MNRLRSVCFSVFLTALLVFVPGAQAKTFSPGEPALTMEEDNIEINVGLLLQPRFEYENRTSDNTTHTSFSAQRVRGLLKGQAYTPHLKYKVLTEFGGSGSPSLLEGWVQYDRFDPFSMRMGQMTVPFNRERDVPVTKLMTTQRSLTNGEFNWPSGRDIGFMVSQDRLGGLEYRLGVYGGERRNVSESSSNGLMSSGRATYEILGKYNRSESFYQPVKSTNLTLGSGLLYAYKNTARNWLNSVGVSGVSTSADTANIQSATADLQLRLGNWNVSGTYFVRTIEDYGDRVNDVDGTGYTVQTGYILSPGTLYLNARHAQIYPNDNQRSTRERESTLGLHLFQKEHKSQVRFELGLREDHTGSEWQDNEFGRIQQQLSF